MPNATTKMIRGYRHYLIVSEGGDRRVIRTTETNRALPAYCVQTTWYEAQTRVIGTGKLGGFGARFLEDDPTKPPRERTHMIAFERRKEAIAFRENDPRVVSDLRWREPMGSLGEIRHRKVYKITEITEITDRKKAIQLSKMYNGGSSGREVYAKPSR